MWCWRRLESPLNYKEINQSILKEMNPEYSLEGLILKLKLQYFVHLIQRVDSLKKILILGMIEDKRRKGLQRMRWFTGHYFLEIVMNSGAWPMVVHWVAKSWICLNNNNNISIELVMPSNHLILCRPLLLLPSIFPSIRVFSSESALHIRWPKYWSFSFRISPSNEYSGWISFRIDWFDLLESKGLSRVISRTTVQKHQFFGTQPSLWSNLHIHTWLLEKLWLWLYGPLSAKWYLFFLICCLGLS